MCRSRISLAALALAATVAGCSDPDLYTDRRETVALSAGDAVAANKVTHMVDPWPPYSGNRNIAFDGNKMQSAVQRYRTGKIIQPVSPMTSSAQYGQQQQQNGAADAGAAPTRPAGSTP
jgi:hypothetical protein